MPKQVTRPQSRRPRAKVQFSPTEDYIQRAKDVARMRAQYYGPGLRRGRLTRILQVWKSDRWSQDQILDVLFYRSWRWVVETGEEEE